MNWNADLYNQKHAFVYHYGEELVDVLNPLAGERILDVGCGSGELTQRIAERGATVFGIDASATMIAKAQLQFPTLQLYQMDVTRLAFHEPFDALFSNAVLHWVADYEGAARQMSAALKPGGRLVVEFGGKGNVATIVDAVAEQLANYGYSFQPFWYFPTIGEYASVLERYGLRVRLAQHYDRPTPLTDPETGLIDWIDQFGSLFFENVEPTEKEMIRQNVNEQLRPLLFRGGQWYADYKRIRIVAERV